MPYGKDPVVSDAAASPSGGYGKDPVVSGGPAPKGDPLKEANPPQFPYDDPNKIYGTGPLSFLAVDKATGKPEPAIPEFYRAPLRGLMDIGKKVLGKKYVDPTAPVSSPDEEAGLMTFGPRPAPGSGAFGPKTFQATQQIPEGYNIIRGRGPHDKQDVIPQGYDIMRDVERSEHRGQAVLRENQKIPENADIMGGTERPEKPGVKMTAQDAIKNGFTLPPNMIGGQGLATKLAAGWAGKIKSGQAASVKNQARVNTLVAEDIGLPEGTAITKPALEAAKSQAARVYDAVRKALKTISLDDDNGVFDKAIGALGDRSSAAAKEYPGLFTNKEIENLTGELGKNRKMSGEAAIDLIRKLRDDAKANFRAREHPERAHLAFAQRQAADAIEALIERELGREATRRAQDPRLSGIDAAGNRTGAPIAVRPVDQEIMQLGQQFHDARLRIAKIHNIEDALIGGTDDVAAARIAALEDKGVVLSGNLKKIADAWHSFKDAMQPPEKFGGKEDFSVLDIYAGAAGMAAGRPELLGAALLRPVVRWNQLRPGSQRNYIAPPHNTTPPSAARTLLTSPTYKAPPKYAPTITPGINPPPKAPYEYVPSQNLIDAINPPVPLP